MTAFVCRACALCAALFSLQTELVVLLLFRYFCSLRLNIFERVGPVVMDEKLLLWLENLSRFELTANEREEIQVILAQMTGSLELLEELDTGGALPMVTPLDFKLKNVLREDRVASGADPAALVDNSPRHKDGYFEVPKTLD